MKRVALLLGLVLASTAGAAATADPGVTAKKIVLGGTVPLSGEASAFGSVGPGAKAYFAYVNAKGGVNGRKIDYRFYDDAYDPVQTVQQTRRLVEQDKVFAIFNSVGTANNKAIQPYLNQRKVPQLFVGDGAQATSQPARYPWTMGFLQSYVGEGAVYGRNLAKTPQGGEDRRPLPERRSREGHDEGLERAIAGKGPQIVAKESYEYTDTDVSSQIASLKSGRGRHVHALRDAEVRDPGLRGRATSWAGSRRSMSRRLDRAGHHGDRAPERTRADEGRAFRRVREEPERPDLAQGSGAQALPDDHEALPPEREAERRLQLVRDDRRVDDGRDAERAGKTPDAGEPPPGRTDSQPLDNPFLLPGIALKTSRTRYFPLDKVYLYRYDNRQWVKASPSSTPAGSLSGIRH